jgi:hypothetical protein
LAFRQEMRRPPRQRIVRVATLAAVVCAGTLGGASLVGAHPPAPFGPGGDRIAGTMHSWLHQAKAPLVRGRVHVLIGGCPGAPLFVGCIFTRRPRVIYLSPAARRPRAVLYHELGHTFDLRVLRPSHRRTFKRMMGIRTKGWFTSSPPAAEWFADGYTFCAERRRLNRARPATPYGYRATPSRHARVCRLIRRAAAEARRDDGKKRPAPRPPADAPRISEPQEPPPPAPPGAGRRPSGPYQPPLSTTPPPPTYVLPGCDQLEALITGCDPDD